MIVSSGITHILLSILSSTFGRNQRFRFYRDDRFLRNYTHFALHTELHFWSKSALPILPGWSFPPELHTFCSPYGAPLLVEISTPDSTGMVVSSGITHILLSILSSTFGRNQHSRLYRDGRFLRNYTHFAFHTELHFWSKSALPILPGWSFPPELHTFCFPY